MSNKRKVTGTPINLEKMRSIGVISRQTKNRVREGREHPDSGKPFKAVTDELGNTQTYHNTGDTERLDAHVRPQTICGFASANKE